MKLSEVITQLKTYAPIFNGDVAGVADYELAKDQIWLPQPAAYVVPLDDECTPNGDLTGLQQVVTKTIGVIVDLDNSPDRRGQMAASDAFDDVQTAVWAALLNWRPVSANAARGFAYARGGFLYADRARLRWQFDFAIEVTLTDNDGFQLSSVPLVDIRGTVINEPTGAILGVFDAALPQT